MKEEFFLLHEKFEKACLIHPEKIAVKSRGISQDKSYTFKEIYDLAQKVASFLIGEGMIKGERVAIISENCAEWISIYFGILSSGGICVPLDPHLKAEEVVNFLKDAQVKFVFISYDLASSAGPLIKKLNFIEKTIILGAAEDSETFISFEAIKRIGSKEIKSSQASFDDIASILYTSGTTAKPKGVVLSHKNFSANFNSIVKLHLCNRKDIFLNILPFYHGYAFMATLLFPVFLGAKIVFPLSLKARDLTNCMAEEKITILVGVPELFHNLHKSIFQEFSQLPFWIRVFLKRILILNYWSRRIVKINLGRIFLRKIHLKLGNNLRYMVSGGARLEPKMARDLFKLGFSILEGYGLSETSPIVCLNPAGGPRFGSVGKALSGVNVKIIHPDKDGVGEVAIRGENVFKGYYKSPDETANAIKEGWFYSGDLGFLDRNKYLYLTGRSKEVIVLSSGKNIYPEEIEEYYKTHVVKELCVLDAKDDKGIVSLQAVVVPNFDYFKIAEGGNIFRKIKWEFENISQNLTSYKRITGFILTKDDLPRTSLGKIKRYEVKAKYVERFGEKREAFEEKRELSDEDIKLINSSFANKVTEFFRKSLSLKEMPGLDDHLELDLGVDSLAKIELIAGLEKLFNLTIPDKLAQEITNVRQAILKLRDLFSDKVAQRTDLVSAEPSWEELLAVEPSDEVKNKIELNPSVFNKIFTVVATKLFFAILKIFFNLKVTGEKNIPPEGHFIFCANHASYLDGLVVAAAVPPGIKFNLYFIGWKQIFEHPSLKWSNKIARLVPIDSSAELMNTMQIASFLLRNQKNICIFPEGQRTIDGQIKEFRKGVGILVKELAVSVVPLAIKGTFQAWSRTRKFPKLYPIKVIFGKPITKEEILSKISTEASYETISSCLREEVEKLFPKDD